MILGLYYLRRSATEAQLGLEFESVPKMSLGLEFMVVSLSSEDASSGQIFFLQETPEHK